MSNLLHNLNLNFGQEKIYFDPFIFQPHTIICTLTYLICFVCIILKKYFSMSIWTSVSKSLPHKYYLLIYEQCINYICITC